MAISNNLGAALSQGFSTSVNTFMQQLPMIIQQYNKEARQKKGQSILDQFDAENPIVPEQQTALGQMSGQPAQPTAQPQRELTAVEQMDLDSGVTPAPTAMQQIAEKAPPVEKPKPTVDPRAAWEKSITEQESGKFGYDAPRGVKTKHGQAVGKYQIMPKFWFKKIGLDSNSEADIKKFEGSPELQDKLFKIVADDAWKQAGGDPYKAALVYYSGSPNPKNIDKVPQPNMPTPRQYAEQVTNRLKTADGAEGMMQKQVKKEGLLTNFESFKAATETLDALIADNTSDRPTEQKGRITKKLEYFYENASPDVIEAMGPMIKKMESMSNAEKAKFEGKVKAWEKEADRRTRAVIAKAQLAASMQYKQETLDLKKKTAGDKTKQALRAEQIKKLKLLSDNYNKEIANVDKKIAQSKTGKRSQREQFKKDNPELFKEVTIEDGGFLWFDKKELVVDPLVRQKLVQQLDDVNEKLRLLEGLPLEAEIDQALPTTGGESPKKDYSSYFRPVGQ